MKMKDLIPLIDCDGIVYRCGFAAQKGEPIEYTLHTVKKTLLNITDKFDTEPVFVISGKTNFRDTYCSILPRIGPKSSDGSPWQYKGNRIGAPKPERYADIREYLKDTWKAYETKDIEADDYISSTAYCDPNKYIIVSQDKDFKTIRGYHYNWVKNKEFKVSKNDADLFLLYQTITGDRVDHIPGVKGYGEVKAKRIIQESGKDVESVKRKVSALYQAQYGKDWKRVVDEVSTLLFLLREPDKKYYDYIGTW